LIVGRKGQPTRFEFDEARTFVDGSEAPVDAPVAEPMHLNGEDVSATKLTAVAPLVALINRIFVTHGKKTKILEQIKRTITSVGLEPVGAR
jgi:hypothetical protein